MSRRRGEQAKQRPISQQPATNDDVRWVKSVLDPTCRNAINFFVGKSLRLNLHVGAPVALLYPTLGICRTGIRSAPASAGQTFLKFSRRRRQLHKRSSDGILGTDLGNPGQPV